MHLESFCGSGFVMLVPTFVNAILERNEACRGPANTHRGCPKLHESHEFCWFFYAYTAAKCVKPNVMQKACLRGMHYKCLNFHISNLINTETMQDGDM